MRRLLAFAVLLLAALPAVADRIAPRVPQPLTAATTSDAVVVGTITAIEDDSVKAIPHPGAKEEIEYRVLVVKIDEGLSGVKNLTQVRVALTAEQFNSPLRAMKEDAKFLFYLAQHHTTNLYVLRPEHPSVNMTDRKADEMLRRAKVATTAINDPMKALKAEAKADRVLAACALALHYQRSLSVASQEVERPADESKLLLETLAEGDWTRTGTADDGNPLAVMFGLGLGSDGWHYVNDTKGKDPAAYNHETFKKWLAGPGKEARVKQLVPKK